MDFFVSFIDYLNNMDSSLSFKNFLLSFKNFLSYYIAIAIIFKLKKHINWSWWKFLHPIAAWLIVLLILTFLK